MKKGLKFGKTLLRQIYDVEVSLFGRIYHILLEKDEKGALVPFDDSNRIMTEKLFGSFEHFLAAFTETLRQ